MDSLLSKLSDFGLMGVIVGILIYDIFFLQKKLISIIENNTKALTELKDAMAKKG